MSATPSDMARRWRQREAEARARATGRAQRLVACLPHARDLLLRSGAKRVWLFGSLAMNEGRENSDVDLAVEGLPASAFFDVLSELMAVFAGPVDLVRIEDAPESLRRRVLEEGKPL